MMILKRVGWVLLFWTSFGGTAFADVAGTLEDYLYCQDEAGLTNGRTCFKCLGTEVSDYENTTSLPTCKTAAEFEKNDYEKVCQSETYLEVWGEVWCKIVDTDTASADDTETADTAVDGDTGTAGDTDLGTVDTDSTLVEKKKSSSGCSAAEIGDAASRPGLVTFLRVLLGL